MGKLRFSEDSSRDSKRKPIPSKKLLYVYKTVAQIINKALNQEGTLRNLVYEHAKTLVKTHLRLAIEVVRHRNLLEKLVSETGLAKKENLDADLAQVLVYELVLGERKELPQGLEIFDQVTAYQDRLQKALHKAEKSADFKQLVVNKPEASVPRYGRVNTLLTDLESVVSNLQKRGFSLIDLEGKTYEEFLDCVRNLQDKEFVLDFHFPKDLLVFNPRQVLANLFVHKAGHLVIQDKTSYFPVACLGAPPGSVVLDACAAPGMKTIHIAAKMNNQGKIYAFDPHETRFASLQENLKVSGVKCCTAKCVDFMTVHPLKTPHDKAEYVLLDPPCTGSGIVNRLDHLTDRAESKSYDRIRSLSALQFKLLCQAAKFPNVKRIVYSTCSVEVQENEQVIKDFTDKNQGKFSLCNALPEWTTRGKPEFDFSKLCVRSSPETDLTNGFFVAVLERNDVSYVPQVEKKANDKKTKEAKQTEITQVKEAKPIISNLKPGVAKRLYVRKRMKRGKRERQQQPGMENITSGKKAKSENLFPKGNTPTDREKEFADQNSESNKRKISAESLNQGQKNSKKFKNNFQQGNVDETKQVDGTLDVNVNSGNLVTDNMKRKKKQKNFDENRPEVNVESEDITRNVIKKNNGLNKASGHYEPAEPFVKKMKKKKQNNSCQIENVQQEVTIDDQVTDKKHKKKKHKKRNSEEVEINSFHESEFQNKVEEISSVLEHKSKKSKKRKLLNLDDEAKAETDLLDISTKKKKKKSKYLEVSDYDRSVLELTPEPKRDVTVINLDDTGMDNGGDLNRNELDTPKDCSSKKHKKHKKRNPEVQNEGHTQGLDHDTPTIDVPMKFKKKKKSDYHDYDTENNNVTNESCEKSESTKKHKKKKKV